MKRLRVVAVCVLVTVVCGVASLSDDMPEGINESFLAVASGTGRLGDVAQGSSDTGSEVAVSGRVVVLTDLDEMAIVELALELLGEEYEVYRDDDEFFAALEEATWDLAIVEIPRSRHDSDPITAWVEGGGRLILSMWEPSDELLAAMGTEAIGSELGTALPIYSWDTSGVLFARVEEVPPLLEVLDEIWGDNGQRLEPQGDAVALAGFVASAEANEAAIVLANAGRTLMNGFLFSDYQGVDGDEDGVDDVVELVANEIAYLLGAGSSAGAVVERRLEPGVVVEGEIGPRGFERIEDTISGYVQYTVSVPTAWALSIRIQGEGNLDLYVRAGRPVGITEDPESDWIVEYDLAAVSSGGEEYLVIAGPQPDVQYWIAVENRGDEPATYTIEVQVTPLIADLPFDGTEGSVALGAVPAFFRGFLRTSEGMLAPTQYRFTAPSSGEALSIRVEGSGTWCAHLRWGAPVEASLDGVVSDLSFRFTDVGEFTLGGILPAGDYYLALEALSLPQSYTLTLVE